MTMELAQPATQGYGIELLESHDPQDLIQSLQDNDGVKMRPHELVQIKIPGSGGTIWQFETVDGSQDEKALRGIIVHTQTIRQYYLKRDDDSKVAPDCQSRDGKTGTGNPGGTCENCMFNQWKDEMGNDKIPDCKEKLQVFILTSHSPMPFLVTLAPTSLQPWRKYVKELRQAGSSAGQNITEITLEKIKGAKQDYGKCIFKRKEALTRDEVQKIKQYKNVLLDYVLDFSEFQGRQGEDLEPVNALETNDIPWKGGQESQHADTAHAEVIAPKKTGKKAADDDLGI
jgi:hypothetical protein